MSLSPGIVLGFAFSAHAGWWAAVASVAQMQVPPDVGTAHGAVWIGGFSIATGILSIVGAVVKSYFDDLKDRRNHELKMADVTEQLARSARRIAELEKAAANLEELKAKARELEIRYELSQQEVAELQEFVGVIVPNVGANADDIARLVAGWKRSDPPKLSTVERPSLPALPASIASKSSSGITPAPSLNTEPKGGPPKS